MKHYLVLVCLFVVLLLAACGKEEPSAHLQGQHSALQSRSQLTSSSATVQRTVPTKQDKTTTAQAATLRRTTTREVSSAPCKPLEDITNYACYYGSFHPDLRRFDFVIVESAALTAGQIAQLKRAGTLVVAYLSIGEQIEPADLKASYLFLDTKGNPVKNKAWGSYYVNAADENWRKLIFNQAEKLYQMGFDGLFLDTLDTAELYPQSAPGMASLVRELRRQFPEGILVANRGFTILPHIADVLDGLLFECFSSDYDAQSKRCYQLEGQATTENRELFHSLLQPFVKRGLTVLTLDYCEKTETAARRDYEKWARNLGCIPYCANGELDQLYLPPVPG